MLRKLSNSLVSREITRWNLSLFVYRCEFDVTQDRDGNFILWHYPTREKQVLPPFVA